MYNSVRERIVTGQPPPTGRIGRIVVRGAFGPTLLSAFPECEIAVLSGETHLAARVRDEAELFGVVERLRGFGGTIASVSLDP